MDFNRRLRSLPPEVNGPRFAFALIAWIAFGWFAASPSGANPVTTGHARAQLIADTRAVRPGQAFWVALRLTAQEGWHTYWRHPGDSGLATRLTWTLPDGFRAGDIQWPFPERIPVGPLANYGYRGEVVLPVSIRPPESLAGGEAVVLRLRADWLICREDCIPETAALELRLPAAAADAPPDPRWVETFAAARRALPVPAPWPVAFSLTPDTLTLAVSAGPAAGRVEALEFFALEDGVIEHAAPQTLHRDGEGWRLSVARGSARELPDPLAGVVVARERSENGAVARNAFEIAATRAGAPPPSTGAPLAQTLLLALAGGLLLNLMPCVFPVLSLKALGLARQAGGAPRAARIHGLAYTAGVLVCFALVAGALIALRAAGHAIGWGFQLQSPAFVTLLAYVLFGLGLSLSGVFTVGGAWLDVGGAWADRPGYAGSFATGALAVVVASPCTAPFMGAALGFALTQPWWVSLVVFQALGLGLALPYLALSLQPALLRRMPRPGPWLERGKQLLAFPLYATAAWLVWVLARQAGPDGVAAALAGLILIAFALWLVPACDEAGSRGGKIGRAGAAAALIAALGLAGLPLAGPAPDAARDVDAPPALGWEPFSPDRVATLRAAGRPVLINFTAAWCITCLVNERVALDSARVAAELKGRKVAYLKADWTRRDPTITAALADFGRAGVPLYVLYRPGAPEPTILPQLLTESLLLDALKSL